ncbi:MULTISPECIES: CBS domain-containing protein [Pandoraea]|uniref:CBS domain-containing protein n=1 Tax=Pandoraea TaxID=93217 RepID=UPI001F5DD46C|nr:MULTISPECIES: CBS domain-containing protein [Pandoraea]MCI3203428.1 inosine-5-monophosphate dehydrogenase [Pandoraea sp. LA3]MDN4581454.1 inosine-5-monophosphate dehydrogenase [Pandoraea capi]
MKTVAQILKSKSVDTVYKVRPSDSVLDALTLMAEARIGAVLVSDDDRAIVGIFTERDYARKVALMGRTSVNTPIRDVMTSAVRYVHPEQTLEECMSLMTEHRIRHLPVMKDDQLVGLLSIGDLVKAIISDQQFTIDQLETYIMGGSAALVGSTPSRPS